MAEDSEVDMPVNEQPGRGHEMALNELNFASTQQNHRLNNYGSTKVIAGKSWNSFPSITSQSDHPSQQAALNVERQSRKDQQGDDSSDISLNRSQSKPNETGHVLAGLSLPLEPGDVGNEQYEMCIGESDTELQIKAGSGDDQPIDLAIARDSMKVEGVPTLNPRLSLPYEHSEISDVTDLGNSLYARKSADRKLSQSLPLSASDVSEPLQDRLFAALQGTPGHKEKKGFFPRDQLTNFVDEYCVIKELKLTFESLDSETIRKYAQKICGDSGKNPLLKKIFVILVLIDKTSTIPKFLEERVTDDDLPLARVSRPGESDQLFSLGRREKFPVSLDVFRNWRSSAIRNFEEWQWSTTAPFFAQSPRKMVKHFVLQDQVVLPFVDCRGEASACNRLEFAGGFSQVYKVGIHPEHHDFYDTQVYTRGFAIKCLSSRNTEDFKREVETLKKFSGDSHPHLVSLLATYEQFGKFYLMFHWADSDLLQYWKIENPNPIADLATVLWMASQCRGIADGLAKVHQYESSDSRLHPNLGLSTNEQLQSKTRTGQHQIGRHGDIKPANVLWFRNPNDVIDKGTLKITDFGLAEFSSRHSKFYKPSTEVANSPSYRAPECDLQGGQVGRSYDIWMLGCLYLEFITWILGGWNLLEEFTQKRKRRDPFWYDVDTDTFFEIVKCVDEVAIGARIKPEVTDFIRNLHALKSCTEYFHDFLNLIQLDMMIVKPNDPAETGRISCVQLHHKLNEMLHKCQTQVEYASKPAPWSTDFNLHKPIAEVVEARLPAESLEGKVFRTFSGHMRRLRMPTAAPIEVI